jgi:hypothetical protein
MRAAVPDRPSEMLTGLKRTAIRDRLNGLLDEAGRQELSLRETLVLPVSGTSPARMSVASR